MERVTSGSAVIDQLLDGGFEKDTITTIYGPSGTGKTNICIVALASVLRTGKKAVYIDTEGGFSVDRFKQVVGEEQSDKLFEQMIFLKPTRFSEQREAFGRLSKIMNEEIGIVIVDTISMLYRLEIGQTKDVYTVNKDLGMQIAYASEIARRKKIPVLITNQVYSSFEERENIKMVGGDILKYGSKCLIELQKGHNGIRKAVLKKHRSIAEGREVIFKIVNEGLVSVSQ